MINIRMKAKERSFEKGSVIIARNATIPTAMIIITGSVREQF
jgi:CRP-like cAMP-binding protein